MTLTMSGRLLVSEAKKGSRDGVGGLLQSGVPPDARDAEGTTALFWASCQGDADICRLLLRYGADVNSTMTRTGATSLIASADNNQVDCLEELLRHGDVGIDQQCARGDTALHKGTYRGYTQVVRLLVQHNANPFLENDDKKTALDEALTQCQLGCVDLLRHYMTHYKPDLATRRIISYNSKAKMANYRGVDHQSAEDSWRWSQKEMTNSPSDGIPKVKNGNEITKPRTPPSHSQASLESTGSAGLFSQEEYSIPSDFSNDSLSSSRKPSSSSYDSPPPKDNSLGYGDSLSSNEAALHFDDDDDARSFSIRSDNSESRSNSTDPPVSVDSQYQSLSPYTDISSQRRRPSVTIVGVETVRKDSLSRSNSKRAENEATKPEWGEKSQRYSKEENDLSLSINSISDVDSISITDNYNILPSGVQCFNILPDRVEHCEWDLRENRNRSSETNCLSSDKLTPGGISGKQKGVSEFVGKLQEQLLRNRRELRREQEENCDLRQRMNVLKEENARIRGENAGLKSAINLFHALPQRSGTSVRRNPEPKYQ